MGWVSRDRTPDVNWHRCFAQDQSIRSIPTAVAADQMARLVLILVKIKQLWRSFEADDLERVP